MAALQQSSNIGSQKRRALARWVTWYRRPDGYRTFGTEDVMNTSLHFPADLSATLRARIVAALEAGTLADLLLSLILSH